MLSVSDPGKRRRKPIEEPTVLSAFSGVGGLDLGLEASGFRTVGCMEIDATACRSLKANRSGQWPILGPSDIRMVALTLRPADLGLQLGELTLLAGAPPCQPFSKAAMWAPAAWAGLADERVQPLFAFFDLIDRFLPRAVLLENVDGFLRGRHSAVPLMNHALDEINSRHGTSYTLDGRTVDAADFGVPQHRRRAILVALRDHQSFQWPVSGAQTVRAWDALQDLIYETPPPSLVGKWAKLLPSIPEGQNYQWHTDRGGGRPIFGYRTRYWSFLLKLAKDLPAWTLPAQPGPSVGPFHWENRPLRTSEMLRLQSFPADWVVGGTRREQVLQVGNATPPLLGEVFGRSVLTTLDDATWPRPPSLAIARVESVPGPEKVGRVPAAFRALEGNHPPHPGKGRGPRPRTRG